MWETIRSIIFNEIIQIAVWCVVHVNEAQVRRLGPVTERSSEAIEDVRTSLLGHSEVHRSFFIDLLSGFVCRWVALLLDH